MAITIYGACASPFVRKVILVAELLELPFDNVNFSPFNKPEGFEKISPLGKIPALTDGDFCISDSSVICDYLNNRYGKSPLFPTDPVLRAKALWFEEYADSKLLELLGNLFFERLIRPKVKNEPTNEETVTKLLAAIPSALDYLEANMPVNDFILGELTIADLAIGSQFINAQYAQFTVDGQQWPLLASYLDRLLKLPCFEKRIAEDFALFSKLFAK